MRRWVCKGCAARFNLRPFFVTGAGPCYACGADTVMMVSTPERPVKRKKKGER